MQSASPAFAPRRVMLLESHRAGWRQNAIALPHRCRLAGGPGAGERGNPPAGRKAKRNRRCRHADNEISMEKITL
ncbi:hypothetical protein BN2497_9065 [Janthinobacterium sp. CG23_2]|nr:hypothetical protein BN2497_9065 [Janthinobacterium sp. CG23_2]CUU30930.1 hypothetical protein BN3177_9065 [Janthinobacterium sp. CG23_2]